MLLLLAEQEELKYYLSAVDYASIVYSTYVAYKQGINPSDPLIPEGYGEKSAINFYHFSRSVFEHVKTEESLIDKRSELLRIPLDDSFPALDSKIVANATLLPPQKEWLFLKGK